MLGNKGWMVALAATLLSIGSAQAQIKVGITMSASGPGAALGQPQSKTVAALPKEIAGQKITYFALDDESDTYVYIETDDPPADDAPADTDTTPDTDTTADTDTTLDTDTGLPYSTDGVLASASKGSGCACDGVGGAVGGLAAGLGLLASMIARRR